MKPNKYKAKKTTVDGRTFDSKKEANRYLELKLLRHAGEICEFQIQPRFPLGTDKNPVLIKSKGYPLGRKVVYVADFAYKKTSGGGRVVEDVKGYDTPVSRLKRAFVEWQYGVHIRLI